MNLKSVLQEVLNDLPWADNVRFLVGDLASRELVKDLLLEQTPAIPAWSVEMFSDFAKEIAGKTPQKLSALSQCDLIQRMSEHKFIKSELPELCRHLRNRKVAAKIARFLTALDRYYETPEELDALVDYFVKEKDQSLGAFLKLVCSLWSKGEFKPWDDGDMLRSALVKLKDQQPKLPPKLPKKIYLWAFSTFTPLEELILEQCTKAGVDVFYLVPNALLCADQQDWLSHLSEAGIQTIAVTNEEDSEGSKNTLKTELWHPHSLADELEFLKEELIKLKNQGTPYNRIAVYVPAHALYKRAVRFALNEWNVPLYDPTLSSEFKDRVGWLWWRDLLKYCSTPKDIDAEKSLMGPYGTIDKDKLDTIRRLFLRSMNCKEFLESANQAAKIAGESSDESILTRFAEHLLKDRPYLDQFKARLSRFVPLFEEFLTLQARLESRRNLNGVHFVGHGVLLAQPISYAFVLGSHSIRRKPSAPDLLDWESIEVERVWKKIHHNASQFESRKQIFEESAFNPSKKLTVSALQYDLNGAVLPKSPFFSRFEKSHPEFARRDGHHAVGWMAHLNRNTAEVNETVLRQDLAPQDKKLRVSAFEDYLKCPFLYYARHVLKLEPEIEPGLEPDPKSKGILFHKILENFLKSEITDPVIKDEVRAFDRLEQVANHVFSEMKPSLMSGLYPHPALIKQTENTILLFARQWLRWEIENRKKLPHVRTIAVEAPFEMNLSTDVGTTWTFKGKIDRIDSDGTNAVVIDYKTGASPFSGKELLQGLGAQLVLYSRSVEKKFNLQPAAAFYLSVGKSVDSRSGFYVKRHSGVLHSAHARNSGLTDLEFDAIFSQAFDYWKVQLSKLERGDFKAAPARPSKDCGRCLYQDICGFEKPE